MSELTERQQEIVDYIVSYKAEHEYPPAVRDMADNFGLSINGIVCHLKALEKKGVIERDKYVSRGIRVLKTA